MSGPRKPFGLSGAEKSALLSSVRRTNASETPRAAPDADTARRRDVSFETLPGYRMIKTQRAAGDLLGIGNPFYREHTARAGRHTEIDGRELLNFASYDYLGLNAHPEITAAVAQAAARWGTSVSASRITAGERPFHRELERELADVYEAEDCLVFVSGHATNVSVIPTIVGNRDLIVHDSLAHNSILVGAELASAHRRSYPHNDLDALEAILAAQRDDYARCLIVTEGLFSMDGDGPDLARLIQIKERWGAWLMIDEAHSLGVLGKTGRGIAEHAGIDPKSVDIWMGTLSKTLVGCGGYIAGSAALVEYLRYQSPGMVYSVGLPATSAIASLTALRIMRREPERVARLQANGGHFLTSLRAAGLDGAENWGYAVAPVVIGDSLRTVKLADRLFERGLNVFPIIPPGVPEKSARLRFFLSSEHTTADLDLAVSVVAEELQSLLAQGLSIGSLAQMIT